MFVAVRSYDNYIKANIELQGLESEGIRAYLQDEYSDTVAPFLSNAIGGIKLMVFHTQVERAGELLEAIRQKALAAPSCPNCYSGLIEVLQEKPPGLLGRLLGKMTNRSPALPGQKYQCNNCSHIFRLQE